MAFLGKARKIDLTVLAFEMGEQVPEDAKVIDLRDIIIKSKNYEEVFVKNMLEAIVNERLDKEKAEREKENIERSHELEKLKIQSTDRLNDGINSVLPDQHQNSQKEFHKLMHKYNVQDGDISFYLVLFERQARRVELNEEQWVSYLLGLLPYDLTQLIAREPEEKANDYEHIKQLLLKRLKLTPEQFRLKFEEHVRTPRSTWKDFGFELRNYFDEWISGLKVNDFDTLKEVIITAQLKKCVPVAVREHFIDDWAQINNSEILAQKLDEYDSVRASMRTQYVEGKNAKYSSKVKLSNVNNDWSYNRYDNFRNSNELRRDEMKNRNVKFQDFRVPENGSNGNKNIRNEEIKSGYNKPIRNAKGEPKCFSCNSYGHISKDCSNRKKLFTCNKCGEKGHTMKYCTVAEAEQGSKGNNLSVRQNNSETSFEKASTIYTKAAIINGEMLHAILDTGSSSCLLRESVSKRLNLSIQPNESELFGFGNQAVPASRAHGKTILDIKIDDVIGRNVPVLIVKDDAQPYDLIIGRTWIDLPYIAYVKVGNKFKLGYAHDDLFSHVSDDINTPQQTKLVTCNAIQVDSNTVSLIKTKTEEISNGLVLFKGVKEDVDSLFEVVNGESRVPVLNLGNKGVTLKKNQCIGRVEVLKEDEWDIMGLDVLFQEIENEDINGRVDVSLIKENRPIILEEIKFDDTISSDKKEDILQLVNKYRDCFALNLSELGCTDLCKMDIKEIDGSKPIFQRPYKTTAEERKIIKNIVDDWKENGIVTDTRSPYASPVLLVKKKTGEHRLVVDYRKLNSQTVKDRFPLPRIDDLLECLGGCTLFTTLDLAHGYLQIPLTEEAKLKTAFITPDGTGQFEKMIFGLCNAPSEFQRLMNRVLGGLINRKVLCYLDDIIIPAQNWRDMMDRLSEVFECLRSAKLTLKLSKCEFGRNEVEFLGFIIDATGTRPGTRKVKAIEEFPEPQNVHEVRRFLGLTNFFRRFVKKYAEKAEPITKLTRKSEKFIWGAEQNEAFRLLKKNLTTAPILSHYNADAETEVHTDASSIGIAGMLLQKGEDGKMHLVYCVSKRNTEAENKYHSSKLELMAIVWTLDRLRQYLLGIHFTIVTDCQALVYLNTKKSSNPQIARWCNLIQDYDFEIKHRPGVRMAHIDAVSRCPVSEPEDALATIIERRLEVCLTLSVEEQVLIMQHSDSELKRLISIFEKESSELTEEEKRTVKEYIYKNSKLYRKIKDNDGEKLLYVLPKGMRKSTVIKFHDLSGHFSVERTVKKIRELYWFPSMKRYVRRHISMCFECLMNKTPAGKQQGVLHPIKPGKRPFEIIHLDHLGPFIRSTKGNRDLLVLIDNFTRFVRLYPVKSTSTKHVLKALSEFVNDFGLPERIISDRGTCFTSHQFEDYCRLNGISHTLNSTSHPRANGMVERVNRTVLPVIITSMEKENHKDWDARLKEVERNLNNMVNKTSNKTPFEMLHGYSPRYYDGLLRKLADEEAFTWRDPKLIQEEARERIEQEQVKTKQLFDRKKSRTLSFDPGEVVVVRRQPKQTGEPTKTQPKYRGPMVVTEVLPNDTYRITQLEEKRNGRFYATTAHVSQLKSWHCEAESSESSDDENDTRKFCNRGRLNRQERPNVT